MGEKILSLYSTKNPTGVTFEVLHEAQTVPMIQELVQKVRPRLIIELGTAGAGMTAVFKDAAPKAFIRSFGKSKSPSLGDDQYAFFDGRTAFIQVDILRQPDVILNCLKWEDRKILYCDGGDKTVEVKLFSRFLKVGDVLGVHDWTSGYHDPFLAQEQVITPYLVRFGFKPLEHDKFEKAASRSRFWVRSEILGENLGG